MHVNHRRGNGSSDVKRREHGKADTAYKGALKVASKKSERQHGNKINAEFKAR